MRVEITYSGRWERQMQTFEVMLGQVANPPFGNFHSYWIYPESQKLTISILNYQCIYPVIDCLEKSTERPLFVRENYGEELAFIHTKIHMTLFFVDKNWGIII